MNSKIQIIAQRLELNKEQKEELDLLINDLFKKDYIICTSNREVIRRFDSKKQAQLSLSIKDISDYKEGFVYDYEYIIIRSDFMHLIEDLKGHMLSKCNFWDTYEEGSVINGKGVIMDKEDLPKLNKYWAVVRPPSKNKLYSKPYVMVDSTALHRLVTDAPKGMVVDHINGNTLDNRKQNLRVISAVKNVMNRKPTVLRTRNKTSIYRGVSKYKNKWYVEVQIMKQRVRTRGTSEIKMARLYDAIVLCLAPNYMNTNFPKENYPEKMLEKFKNLYLKNLQVCL